MNLNKTFNEWELNKLNKNIDNLNSDMEFLFDKIKFLTYEMPIVNKGTLSELQCYQDFININNKLINYHSKRLKLESNIKNAN